MTDERIGDRLIESIAALPRGSGIVFRHYSLAPTARRALFDQVRAAARAYRHVVVIGGDARTATAWRADGSHQRAGKPRCSTARRAYITSAPVHSLRELIAAQRAGVDCLFVSPVFATRSHIGAVSLGRARFGLLINQARLPVIALGGMNVHRARALRTFNIHGWAAIDSLTAR